MNKPYHGRLACRIYRYYVFLVKISERSLQPLSLLTQLSLQDKFPCCKTTAPSLCRCGFQIHLPG